MQSSSAPPKQPDSPCTPGSTSTRDQHAAWCVGFLVALTTQLVTLAGVFTARAYSIWINHPDQNCFSHDWWYAGLFALVLSPVISRAVLLTTSLVKRRGAAFLSLISCAPALLLFICTLNLSHLLKPGSAAQSSIGLRQHFTNDIQAIKRVLPHNWTVRAISETTHPLWTYPHKANSVLIKVSGPMLGYRDLRSCNPLHPRTFYQEAREIWLMEPSFTRSASFISWIASSWLLSSQRAYSDHLPIRLLALPHTQVFGCESIYPVKQPRSIIDIASNDRESHGPPPGGSWPTWLQDVKRALASLE